MVIVYCARIPLAGFSLRITKSNIISGQEKSSKITGNS
jgi:hypothetical protein